MRTLMTLVTLLGLTAASLAQPPKIPESTTTKKTASGLEYCVLKAGAEGAEKPAASDTVKVHYTGWLPNGTIFDSSVTRGKPATFPLSGVIAGWTEGLQLMPVGSKFKFTIPSDLAYGKRGSPPKIGPDQTLIFEIELLAITEKGPAFIPANPEKQKTTESGLKYEVLKAGEGPQFNDQDYFDLKYQIWSEDGKLLDRSRPARPLIGNCAKMNLPFLKEAPLLMKKGTRLRCEVPGKLGFGDRPFRSLKPGATTIWVLDMVRVIPMPTFSPSPKDKLITTKSGLQYEVIKEGSGDRKPMMGEFVTVDYTGWLTDGSIFDSSIPRGEPSSFQLGRVIKGWNEGLQLMKVGAVYKFTIPAKLAYGPRGNRSIPGNATLVFLIELKKIGT